MERNHSKSRRAAGSILLTLSVVACSERSDPAATPVAPPVATRLERNRESVTVVVPATASVTAMVRDQRGAEMPGEPITFTSRDPTVALVDSLGLITAVGGGETSVVASSGTLSDSTEVIVRYDVFVGETRARVRTSKGLDMIRSLSPSGEFQDVLGGTAEDRLSLGFYDEQSEDLMVALVVPGGAATGSVEVGRLDLDELLAGVDLPPEHGIAYVLYLGGEKEMVYTSLPGSRLEIEEIVPAGGMGLKGTVKGRIVVHALGYILNESWDAATPVADTLTVYADFATSYDHFGIGRATITTEGGPLPAGTTVANGWFYPAMYSYPAYLRVGEDFYARLYVSTPVVGTRSLHAADPSTYPSPAVVPYLDVTSYEPYARGYSQSGTVTIDEILPPDGDVWGEIRGRVQASMAYWDAYTWGDPNSTGTMGIEFDLPMIPESYFGAGGARVERQDSIRDRLMGFGLKRR